MIIQGKCVNLGVKDQDAANEALEALKRILAGSGGGAPATLFREVVPAYLEAIAHRVQPDTLAGYAKCLAWASAQFGHLSPGQLDPLAVERAVLSVATWSDSHKCNLLWLIQSAVRWAGRKDFALRRPAKESRGAEMVISDETYKNLLIHTSGDFQQLIRVLWATGARPGEILGLTAGSIDFASGTATLKKHKTKTKGKQRVLYFSPAALEVLRAQCARYPTGPLFRGKGGTGYTGYKLTRRFLRLSEKLGVRVCCYGFRHSFVTRALVAGTPETHVAALVGHTSTAMVSKFYSHVNSNAKLLKDVAARLDNDAA